MFEAAQKDWHEVEPAIFGTLLEQALDPAERKRLGAHYTPRAYVERLVVATVIEPLREDWRNVQAAAETKRAAGDLKPRRAEVNVVPRQAVRDARARSRLRHRQLPLCVAGIDETAGRRSAGGVGRSWRQEPCADSDGTPWTPTSFSGWRSTRAPRPSPNWCCGSAISMALPHQGRHSSEPILHKFKNIEVKNAVLTWDGILCQRRGGKSIPTRRRPTWPMAEFIVGNPPFIGGKDIRGRLGDAYAEALWAAHTHMNQSADFVMYWWDRAADLLTAKGTALRRFGLVTTNSVTQSSQRRVMKSRLEGKHPISLVMAIPDHPWTKATPDAAAVRIAMTVGEQGERNGTLREVIHEEGLDTDQPEIEFRDREGHINSDLTVGADVTSAVELRATRGYVAPA